MVWLAMVQGSLRMGRGRSPPGVHCSGDDYDEHPGLCVPLGAPLRILGLSLPYLLCAVVHPGGAELGPAIIDIRTACLMRVEPRYLNAIRDFQAGEGQKGAAAPDDLV